MLDKIVYVHGEFAMGYKTVTQNSGLVSGMNFGTIKGISFKS